MIISVQELLDMNPIYSQPKREDYPRHHSDSPTEGSVKIYRPTEKMGSPKDAIHFILILARGGQWVLNDVAVSNDRQR